ncbi:MAG: hypothetical protein V1819_03625 [bacterium]
MENNNVEKKKSWKRKIHLVCILLIIGAGICGYFWIKKTNNLRLEAINVIERAEKFDTLKSGINVERDRCKNFIIQEQGDFSSFEYCKKFINWVDSLPSLK